MTGDGRLRLHTHLARLVKRSRDRAQLYKHEPRDYWQLCEAGRHGPSLDELRDSDSTGFHDHEAAVQAVHPLGKQFQDLVGER